MGDNSYLAQENENLSCSEENQAELNQYIKLLVAISNEIKLMFLDLAWEVA